MILQLVLHNNHNILLLCIVGEVIVDEAAGCDHRLARRARAARLVRLPPLERRIDGSRREGAGACAWWRPSGNASSSLGRRPPSARARSRRRPQSRGRAGAPWRPLRQAGLKGRCCPSRSLPLPAEEARARHQWQCGRRERSRKSGWLRYPPLPPVARTQKGAP